MPNVGRICAGLRGSWDTKESHSKAHAPHAFTSAFKMLLFFSWGCFTVPGSVSNSILFIRFSHAELFTSFTSESSCSAQIGWIGGWVEYSSSFSLFIIFSKCFVTPKSSLFYICVCIYKKIHVCIYMYKTYMCLYIMSEWQKMLTSDLRWLRGNRGVIKQVCAKLPFPPPWRISSYLVSRREVLSKSLPLLGGALACREHFIQPAHPSIPSFSILLHQLFLGQLVCLAICSHSYPSLFPLFFSLLSLIFWGFWFSSSDLI